jgi:hypothetical protein
MSLLSKGFEPLFGSLDPGRIRIRIKVTSRGSATLAEDNILMGASLFFFPWTFLLARVFTFFFCRGSEIKLVQFRKRWDIVIEGRSS